MAKKDKNKENKVSTDESTGSKIVTVLIVLVIVVIWLAIFGVLIKLDVGNFGSEVLYPVLKDVPVVNMILPEPAQNQSDTSTSKEYDNLTEANARIKELESQLAANKKILKQAKGYFGAKHYRFRNANQAVMKSLSYAYVGRKDKKSDFRKLWISRINAAARMNGTTYSKMIAGLKKANVTINRKMLAEIAVSDPKAFTEIAEIAKNA